MEGTRRYSFQPPKHAGRAAHAVHFLSALYTSLCIFPSAGPGKTSSVTPWHDCAPCHSQPDGSPSDTDPPSGQLNVPANSRQLGPPGALPAYRLPNYPRHGRTAANIVPVGLPSRRPHPHLSGIWLGPFAFPCPSSLVSTTRTCHTRRGRACCTTIGGMRTWFVMT